jgi:hypothetical protein
MEADSTVPGTVMQVARIYADYAASRGGRSASVSYPVLIRQTHRSSGTLVEAHEWLTDHGWLRLRPGKDGEPWREGQRKAYDLTFGGPGEKREAVRPTKRSEAPNQFGSRNGRTPKRSSDRNGSARGNRFGSRTATVLATETEAFQSPKRERLTSDNVSLPAAGSLHAALTAVVPDATARETEMIRDMIGKRPGVRAANAVMRREIADGNGPALVAAIRSGAPDSSQAGPDRRPASVPYADLHQGRECEHGDPRGAARCALCRHARASPAA